MSADIVSQLLALPGHQRELDAGECLFRQGRRVQALHVVRAGLVDLVRTQPAGQSLILQRAETGAILAEASMYSSHYHCDGVARVPSRGYRVSRSVFDDLLRRNTDVADLWQQHLARETQRARYRAEILALRTVAERLDGWLAWHDGILPARGDWKSLAHEIGVSPEALYRELASRGSGGSR